LLGLLLGLSQKALKSKREMHSAQSPQTRLWCLNRVPRRHVPRRWGSVQRCPTHGRKMAFCGKWHMVENGIWLMVETISQMAQVIRSCLGAYWQNSIQNRSTRHKNHTTTNSSCNELAPKLNPGQCQSPIPRAMPMSHLEILQHFLDKRNVGFAVAGRVVLPLRHVHRLHDAVVDEH